VDSFTLAIQTDENRQISDLKVLDVQNNDTMSQEERQAEINLFNSFLENFHLEEVTDPSQEF